MLVGRVREMARLAGLLEGARQGRSGALVVRGEAGVGKSALLDWTRAQATGFLVLGARGIQSEVELAYAGLADLFRPVLDRLDALPSRQAAALAGALAIADATAPAGERFAVAAATLALLDAASESAPLLAVVDDAHWLDAASAEALLFAARRVQAEGVVLLFAARPGGAGGFAAQGLEELALGGLDRPEVAELLAGRAGRPVAPHVAGELAAQTSGNPLALLELIPLLTAEQLGGVEPLSDPLPAGASAERAFGRRVAALDPPARQALLLAAAGAGDDVEAIWRAAGSLGLGPAAFEQAEAAGLLSIDAVSVSFRHPLVRAAAYGAAAPHERRAVHRALAGALPTTSVADRRAWHLAAAALGPDEDTASQLEAAAERARQRSGFAAAAAALQRAAALSPQQTDRLRRLLAAADAAHRAGRLEHAVRLLEEALRRSDEPALRAAVQHTRGRIELFRGRTRTAARLLADAAAAIRTLLPDQAARMLAEAALAAFLAGEVAESLTMTVEAQQTLAAGGVAELITKLVTGTALFHAGQPAEGVRMLLAAADLAGTADPRSLDVEYVVLTALALMWAGELRRAEAILGPVLDEARRAGALGVLPYALYASCYLDLRVGRLATAAISGAEAARLARDTGDVLFAYLAAGSLALVEAVRGREDACRRHVADGQDLGRQLELDYPHDLADALGLLELGLGRPAEAISHLEAANRVDALGGEPLMGRPSAPDLVEAYVRAGRAVPAGMRRDLEALSLDEALPATAAVAWRCRGLLADEAWFDDCFARALRLHQATGMPWPTARTALAYGERLRRAGRRVDARVQLRLAAETLQRIGATPWAERAASELRATGETARRRDRLAAEELTPQELQIALAVADGGTNREVGAALFLSAKTVEFHLSRVYRKLGVRSRTELTRVLAPTMAAK